MQQEETGIAFAARNVYEFLGSSETALHVDGGTGNITNVSAFTYYR